MRSIRDVCWCQLLKASGGYLGHYHWLSDAQSLRQGLWWALLGLATKRLPVLIGQPDAPAFRAGDLTELIWVHFKRKCAPGMVSPRKAGTLFFACHASEFLNTLGWTSISNPCAISSIRLSLALTYSCSPMMLYSNNTISKLCKYFLQYTYMHICL